MLFYVEQGEFEMNRVTFGFVMKNLIGRIVDKSYDSNNNLMCINQSG